MQFFTVLNAGHERTEENRKMTDLLRFYNSGSGSLEVLQTSRLRFWFQN